MFYLINHSWHVGITRIYYIIYLTIINVFFIISFLVHILIIPEDKRGSNFKFLRLSNGYTLRVLMMILKKKTMHRLGSR